MNTAQLSVLPDDLAAVSLTPLRRAVQRVRTFGARFSELAMPWTAAPGARGQAMDPVSYTHLTLPTNREV